MTKVTVGIDPGKDNCAVVAYDPDNRQVIYFKGVNVKAWEHLLNLKEMFGARLTVRIELPTDVYYERNKKGNTGAMLTIAKSYGINRGLAYAMLDFCNINGITAVHKDCGKTTKEMKKLYVERKLSQLNLLLPTNQHCYDAAYIILDAIQ